MPSKGNRPERLIDMMTERAEQLRDALLTHADGWDMNTSSVTDEQFFAWWAMKTGKIPKPEGSTIEVFPPTPLIMPDGSVQVLSKWEVALALAAEQPNEKLAKLARDLIARYERALLKVAMGEVA